MRTKWFLLGILLGLIIASIAVTVAAPRAQEYQGLQWEYAMAVVNAGDADILISIRDRDEREAVQEVVNDLTDAETTIYNAHNVLGLWGWELVQVDFIEGNQVGTYKRIVVGSGAG